MICERFPGSKRAKWLEVMDIEAKGLHGAAFTAYSKMDPTCAFAKKRIIAMHIKVGETEKAIEELCVYLNVFQADVSAWRQLSELYKDKKRYKKAVYCSEEVILAYPTNCAMLFNHAELVYETGDVALARKYFCRVCELVYEANAEEAHKTLLLGALRGIEKCIAMGKEDCAELKAWTQKKLDKLKLS
jgi:tetratricopeptide (TPR) repeat protein